LFIGTLPLASGKWRRIRCFFPAKKKLGGELDSWRRSKFRGAVSD
jgi:hypothetical protein